MNILQVKKILPSNQRQIIEQAKFTYSTLGKAFEKQIKTIEDQGIKQVKALKALKPGENQELESIEGLFPEKVGNNEIKNEIYEIKKWEEKTKRGDLKHKTKNYIHDFQQYETIRSFGESICPHKININEAEKNQCNLLENVVELNNKSRPKTKKIRIKKILMIAHMLFMKVEN